MAKLTQAEAKAEVIRQIAKGAKVADACKAAGRTTKTYEWWRANDADFAATVDRIRSEGVASFQRDPAKGMPSFPEFSERYLGQKLYRHQLQWLDLLEGREPRELHPAQTYEAGEPDLVMVNTPPEHAKSTTITMNYVTYRICENPNVRVIVVSKNENMAKKFLRGIKTRLTSPAYLELQQRFGPPGGFDSDSQGWSATQIYVSDAMRTSGEKDPTVEALGIGGQIYGARADLIILDDTVVISNAADYEKQIEWIQAEVMSRLSGSGMLLVVGTRLQPVDLYRELRNPERYNDEQSPWTYLTQPAVLEFADDPTEWVTLWPYTNQPDVGDRDAKQLPDGTYVKWDGPTLKRRRARMDPRTWALVYMQAEIDEDTVFPVEAVNASVNGRRNPGPMQAGNPYHRPAGMDGLYVVAGLDPATAGHTAAVVIGLDRQTQKRYVLDVYNRAGTKPDQMRALIKSWTVKYGIAEWRIEKNAFQSFLTQDREVREFLSTRGVVLREHSTGSNKWAPDFGVASMSTLFDGHDTDRQLIELPSRNQHEGIKALVEQLTTWFPETKAKTDVVMAMWFAEIRCREIVATLTQAGQQHRPNPYATRRQKRQRHVVSFLELEQEQYQSIA